MLQGEKYNLLETPGKLPGVSFLKRSFLALFCLISEQPCFRKSNYIIKLNCDKYVIARTLKRILENNSISFVKNELIFFQMEGTGTFLSIKKLNRRIESYIVPDNYQILWAADGLSEVTVDFQSYPFHQNSLFFLTTGRIVNLQFSGDQPKGWIMNISRDYLKNQLPDKLHLKNIDIFHTYTDNPRIVLSPKIGERIHTLAEMISELSVSAIPGKEMAISALFRTMFVYIGSRCNISRDKESKKNSLNIVSQFKVHVSRHFLKTHKVSAYADMLHVTPKYLTQVVKQVMGVTAKQIIREQLLVQSYRDLKFSNDSIKEIAFKLGFSEPEHFSHFFKKSTGHAPSEFRDS
jgi:AraC family transcriptional regulator, transcriptional activator of pobA